MRGGVGEAAVREQAAVTARWADVALLHGADVLRLGRQVAEFPRKGVAAAGGVNGGGLGDLTVTYHDSCHLTHGQKVTKQPRELLKLIPGLKLVELPEANWCCGSAGIYNITQPEQSEQLLVRKIGHVIGTGASVLATANPGCHLQIARGLRQAGSPITLLQPVTLLARAYRAESQMKDGR